MPSNLADSLHLESQWHPGLPQAMAIEARRHRDRSLRCGDDERRGVVKGGGVLSSPASILIRWFHGGFAVGSLAGRDGKWFIRPAKTHQASHAHQIFSRSPELASQHGVLVTAPVNCIPASSDIPAHPWYRSVVGTCG